MIKPEKLDASTTLNGMDYIDVPGGVEKKYNLKFFAHKEGAFASKVHNSICDFLLLILNY